MPKTCGSVVDCSLVLFSIFGLFALHQKLFSFFLFVFFFFFLWGGGGGGKKRAVMDNWITVNPVSL